MKAISMCIAAFAVCMLLIDCVYADCYLQYPPGSNDRLNEAGQDRNDGNRLFRSENNARGGYCWGPSMSFYAGSVLPVQWTVQHGCGQNGVDCNMVLQYSCSNDNGDDSQKMRDGSTTDPITDDATDYNKKNTDGSFVYGMHESYQYYQDCKARERNKGLFTADQTINGNDARFTRQENNGQKFGFECNEEGQYYPYWHPSPWKDIAVMVQDKNMCSYFQSNSQNVKSKNHCQGISNTNNGATPNNAQACQSAGGQWVSQSSWGIPAPNCVVSDFSRDNHLGNTLNGQTPDYNWTIPSNEDCIKTSSCSCVIRLRYNISTSNTDNWGFSDSRQNGANSPVQTDPDVSIEGNQLTLALNTNQYGRTFQDRSHVFKIIPRPSHVSSKTKIWNLGVRGKRGNIVETFPATEYDFIPQQLSTTEGDYIHFQWTGCDTNPANNAGEGIDQTDRSNIVQIQSRNHNIPLDKANLTAMGIKPLFESEALRTNMAYIGQTNCPSLASLLAKHNKDQDQVNIDPTNCAKLNAAPTPHFDAGLVKMNTTGTYHYMSTRNNNFSNRTQKGTIIITPQFTAGQIAGIVIGVVLGVALIAVVAGFFVLAKKKPHSFAGRWMDKISRRGKGNTYSAPSTINGERKAPLLG